MFGVSDSIPDHILKEHLQDTPGLLVDESRNLLDTSPPRKTTDCRLCDSLDVISQHLVVALGTSLSKSCSSFATSVLFELRASFLSLGSLFRLLGEDDGLDVGKNTTLGNGNTREKLVQFLIIPNG